MALLSASPGLSEPSERQARAKQDEAAAEALRREGIDAFLHRWYRAEMWGRLRESPRCSHIQAGKFTAGMDQRNGSEMKAALLSCEVLQGVSALAPLVHDVIDMVVCCANRHMLKAMVGVCNALLV